MNPIIQKKCSRVPLLKNLLIVLIACFTSALYGQKPKIAPPNPEFVKYQNKPNKALTLKSNEHRLGLIPEPFLPHFSKTSSRLLKTVFASKYDLRTAGPGGTSLITAVKDQKLCNSCWAFAAIGTVEGYLKKTGIGDYDFSENNLKECHGFETHPCDEGGNAGMTAAYFARKSGPITETTDPYIDNELGCMDVVNPELWISDIAYLPNDANIIKQAIQDCGALFSSLYWNESNYNSTNYTYYYSGESQSNHAALLVGWDDTKVTDGGTGAWILKNSWGADWGENGFFYISYSDTKVNTSVMSPRNANTPVLNSRQFSYDKLGMINALGNGSNIAYGIIRFSPGNRNYSLKELSTFTTSGLSTVRFDVYDDFDGTTLSNLKGSISEKTCEFPGYYTFDLATPIAISANNDFYIKASYNTAGYDYPIPIEHRAVDYADPFIETGKCWVGFDDNNPIAVGADQEWQVDLCINASGEYFTNAPTVQASNFYVTDITRTSMKLNWTRGNGNGVIVVARQGVEPDSDPTDGTLYAANPVFSTGQEIGTENYVVYNGTGTSISITDLFPGYLYYFAVYEYNAADLSYRTKPLSGNASTICDTYPLPYRENFESGKLPICWTQETGPPKWQFVSGNGTPEDTEAHSGRYNACLIKYSSESNRNKLISPSLNITGNKHVTLKFWHKQDFANSTDDHGELRVYYKTSATGSWNLLATYSYFIYIWQQQILELPNPSSDYYIAFEGDATNGSGVCIDDIEVIGLNCSNTQATNFSYSAISPTIAKISWTRGNADKVLVTAREGEPINFNPVNGKIYEADSTFDVGEAIGSQTGNNVRAVYDGTGNNAIITNLKPDVPYYFAVYEHTTEGCYTSPALKSTLNINCSSGFILPYTEEFEEYYSMPSCWATFRGSNGLGTTNDWFYDEYGFIYGEEAVLRHESVTGGLAEDWLVSPRLLIPSGSTFSLNFDEKQYTVTDNGSQYYIKVSTTSQTDRAAFTNLVNYGETSFRTKYRLRSVDLSEYAGQAIYIAFVMVQNGGDDWYIDNVSVDNTPVRTTVKWTGAISADWNTTSNWSDGELPNIYKSVIVPAGCPNYPIVNETATCRYLTVNDGGSLIITDGSNLNVGKDLTLGNGTSGSFTINSGNCAVAGNFFTEAGTRININGGLFNFANWERNFDNRWAAGDITLTGGTINASGDIVFSHKDITGTMNGPFTCNVGGYFYNSDSTWTVTDGTINLLGLRTDETSGALLCSNATTSPIAYNVTTNSWGEVFFGGNQNIYIKNNLTIEKGSFKSGSNVKTIYINGHLTIGKNTYNIGNNDVNFNLTGNWINKGGYFMWYGGNTVFLTGTNQTISGENTFYNLTKATSTSSKLTFGAGMSNRTTIYGTLTLQGSPGQLLSLRSSIDGEQWEIDPLEIRSLNYLDVKDAKNINETIIDACGLIDSGNNTNWDFSLPGNGTIIGNTNVCQGTTTEYTATIINGATSYIWTLPNGTTENSFTNRISVRFSNLDTSGEIKIKGHNDCGNGPESSLAIIVKTPPSAAGNIIGNTTVCKGVTNKYSIPVIDGATSYIWTLPSSATGVSTTDSILLNFSGSVTSGKIMVKGHNDCGDGTESILTVNVDSVPSPAGNIAGNTIVIKGSTNEYNVPVISGAISYIWTLPSGATIENSANSISVNFGSSATSGDIKVKGYNNCGVGTESTLAIKVNSLPSGAESITGSSIVCKGTTKEYTVPVIADATSYIWTLPSGATGESSTNNISVTFSNSATSGEIKVKGHNSSGNGTESILAVTVNSAPSNAENITGNAIVCKGTTEEYTVPVIDGATSYVWTLPSNTTGTSSTNSISALFGNSATSGEIKVKGHNDCGVGNENTRAITVNSLPLAAGNIVGNTVVCKDSTNEYAVDVIEGATSYIWTLPSGATGESSTNLISVSFSNSAAAGDIKVKGYNNCGNGTESSTAINVTTCTPSVYDEISISGKVKVYPNPNHGLIDIVLIEPLGSKYKIEVFNLVSILQTFIKQKDEKTTKIDITNYPSGVYIIKISSKNKSYHFKIIKN